MLTHEIVQHGWFPNALGTTDHQEGRGAQSFTLRWIDEVLDVSSSRGRAGAGSFLFSLCPAFLTALFMKKPGRNLWMRAWRTSTTTLPVLNNVQPVLTVCAGKALAGCVRAWPLGRTNRPGASSTCLIKMHLRNVEEKGQYIGSVNVCQTGFGIEGCLICKTKQEPQRLTNNSTSLNNSLVEFEPEPTHRNSDHLNNYPLHSIQTLSQQPQQHI